MDDNCHVEPIYKDTVSAETLRNADNALLAVWGMGCENCVTRVRNSLLSLFGRPPALGGGCLWCRCVFEYGDG